MFVYNEGTAAIQTQADTIVVDHAGTGQLLSLTTPIAVKGLACDSRSIIIWSGDQIHVHGIYESHVELISEVKSPGNINSASLFRDNLYIACESQLVVMSLKGMQRTSMDFADEEGSPILTSSVNMSCTLAVITDKGVLKMFDVTNAESMTPLHPSKNLCELMESSDSIEEIVCVGCNATSSLVSLVSKHHGVTKLLVFNITRNELKLICSDESGYQISHFWDPAEPRLLACDCYCNASEDSGGGKEGNRQVLLFFIDEESGGVHEHEMVPHTSSSILIGIDVPHIVFVKDGRIANQVMSDFHGLEEESPLAMAAMIDFCYYSRIGSIDKSFESLQAIRSPRVWRNLIPVCIDMKRLDLTEMCLSHAASADSMSAFQLAKREPEMEVALAAAAIAFGLFDTAKNLYDKCKRFDLLNQLLQRLGEWEKALEVSEYNDRIHLDLTKYRYARHLEENGEFDIAVNIIGKCGMRSAKFQQLVEERRIDELECFVSQQNDKKLYSSFGEFNLSLGNVGKACDYYLLAGDDLKLVELHCSLGDFNEAHRIVEEGGNAAAAHYLAKFYTGSEAVKLYCLGGMFNHAIRIAMASGLDTDLLDIATKQNCTLEQVSSCARYFEKKGSYRNASIFYNKCGQVSKALMMCLAVLDDNCEDLEMNGLLVSLVKKLNGSIATEISHKVINQLQQAGETKLMFDVICGNADDPHACLQFCIEHSVTLTDANAEKLLSHCKDEEAENLMAQLIASSCNEQGNHKLACRLFTKAGEKKLALKCLVKQGDAKAIIEFATEANSKSIYALGANYLQNLVNTVDEALIDKSIIQFYNKAERYDKLVSYYISQSQDCIKKHGHYENALVHLTEASALSAKLNDAAAKEIKKLIGERCSVIEWFVYAKESLHSMDRLSLENLCNDLLSPPSNHIIQEGDCYALLVEYFYALQQHEAAYNYLRRIQEQNMDLNRYLDKSIVKKILQAIGKDDSLSEDEFEE